jgi:hypothetical protein
MERRKSRPGDEKLIYDESADPVERAGAIFRLAVDGYPHMERLLTSLLNHSNYMLRSQSIKILLGGWEMAEFSEKALEMLDSDPDWEARSGAAYALSKFAKSGVGKEYKSQIIRALVSSLIKDDDEAVQESCYEELLSLIAPEKGHVELPLLFDRNRDVDWSLLEPYLNADAPS